MPLTEERAEIELDRIMFATDFAQESEGACAFAVALARRFRSTLDTVHVVDLSACVTASEDLETPFPAVFESAQAAMQRLLRGLTDLTLESTLLESFAPWQALLDHAQKTQPQLIVMGTHSRQGAERIVSGSVAEQIFRSVQVPVLTVGPRALAPTAKGIWFPKIVFAADFTEESRMAATFALAFAQDSGAHLYLCHVLPAMRGEENGIIDDLLAAALQKLIPPTAYDWCSPICVVEHGDALDAILSLADRVEADLIVLGPRAESFHLKYVEAGLTSHVLAKAKCPVLTVRSSRRRSL